MGDLRLCLSLLLLSTLALAYAQDEEPATCLLDKRYKTMHKYEYLYEAESLNAINGASNLRNGPKGSCKVEIEVPQPCSYIVRTSGCSLSEVVDMDAEGNPVFAPAATSDDFAAEMEKFPLKVVVEGVYDVKLYAEEGESMAILNIKRGIISALAVPLVEEEKNKNLPTIHGMCRTKFSVNAREDIATDITLARDLSKCDKFAPMRDHTSPLALISGLHYPLAQLVRSKQTCNYKFDNENMHMTSGSCTENHILVPFSHKGEYGVTNVGKQALTLLEVSAHNDRAFDHNEANLKGLHMEAAEDVTAVQDKDAGLALLRELASLPADQGEKRAHLFHKLVVLVRGLKVETLGSAIPEALEISAPLSYQVLAQCGTPACSSAIMQILKTFDSSALQVDAAVFALGLVSNPSPLLIHDMLEMAQHKPSKAIMYALSNVVKRFYKAEGKLTPEIYAVAEFMGNQLGDCTGDKDHTFMTLRVIGNMAAAMGASSPALRTAVIQCVNEPAASLAVQQAAIQAYRLTPVPEEGREVLMQVLLDGAAPLQKRVAAYLVLMKNPQPSELAQLAAALPIEQDEQAKSFVISHVTNILSSTEPETQELRQKILDALQGNEIGTVMDPTKFSCNYKAGSMEGNMIFEGSSYLPKEVMLDMTLKAFGYEIDMMEIGMEGTGLEPTVEALFGENGFFPDTALKTMYYISDNMPVKVSEVLKNLLPAQRNDRKKREASQSLIREITRNLNRLVTELKSHNSPEAMVYLRLLGNELGYLKTNEMEEMAYSAALMIDNMLKMLPMDAMMGMMTKTDNEVFAHYIFMDNDFFLPTATGVPLKIALSGAITPGLKGGINLARDMSEVSFMPSLGIEFVTHIGSHIPEFVDSGLEMHTNLFHESGLSAKVAIGGDNIKLTIPAPANPVKLFSITNSFVAVTGAVVKTIPPVVEDNVDVNECTPFFTGVNYCFALKYTDAYNHETPYFPFTGDSKFALVLQPTGEVAEYTATLAYELLMEGEEGHDMVDSLKLVLRAEAAEPTEATATLKYNRKANILTTDVQIPDLDLEAGLRLGVVDDSTKGQGTHAISIDLINKNIPQLTLIARAKLEAMKEAMLQARLIVPVIASDLTLTANLKRGDELEFELETDVKIPTTTSVQKFAIKYDDSKIEANVKSDIDSKILDFLPHAEEIEKYVNDLLDMQVGESDMTVRHILKKSVEATNNYLEKNAADVPYIQNFRVPDMPEISLPEKLFLNVDTKAIYYFSKEHTTWVFLLPYGGKSTGELNFPASLSTPHLSLPQLGVELVSMDIPIPVLFVPENLAVSVPHFGKAEVSAMVKSNLYDLEVSVIVGNDEEADSITAKFDVTGTSPVEILAVKIEGSGLLTAQDDALTVHLTSSLAHKFIEASVDIKEVSMVTDIWKLESASMIKATSTLGLNVALDHTGKFALGLEEISAESNLDGKFKAGPIYGNAIGTQSFSIIPSTPEAKIESTLKIDSTIAQAQNTIAGTFANGELLITSTTNVFEDMLTNAAEISFKENKMALKSDTNALALGMKINNLAEASAGAGEVIVKMETTTEHSENRIHSLLTATLDVNGLAVNSDATVKILENEAVHKATATMNKDGLAASGTTTLQSPLTLEITFNAGLDASKATLTINNKAALHDNKIDNDNTLTITLSGLDFASKADAVVGELAAYNHDITVDLESYIASANVKNNLKILEVNLINEAQLKAELYKIDMTGSLTATLGEEEIKHTYEINYADMAASAKCSTNGQLLGTHMNQKTELEVIGLAARIHNEARFTSQPLRFDHSIRASIIPFDFNLDAIFNADGDLTLYGKQSAQLYGKLSVRAQPLILSTSHECRASLLQALDDFSLETTLDNKMDTLLSPQEQRTTLRVKTKINDHALNQDISAYNTPERIGMEVSGTILTNLLNTETTENQEFTIAGFLKYDKNTNSHFIQLPLINDLPELLETIKLNVVNYVEHIKNNNEDIKAKIEALLQYVSDFIVGLDIEGKAVQLKESLIALTQEYALTIDDLEASLLNLKGIFEKLATDIAAYMQHFVELLLNGNPTETVISIIHEGLEFINKEFAIQDMIITVIDVIEHLVNAIDLEKLQGSSIALLHDLDSKFEIKAHINMIATDLRQWIRDFNFSQFAEMLKNYILSINLEAYIEELMANIPTDFVNNIMESVKKMNEDFGILENVNVLNAKLRELINSFEFDKKIEVILDQIVELIKQFKINETIQVLVENLKAIDIPAKLMEILDEFLNHFKGTSITEVIEQLNVQLETLLQMLKSFDYNAFADKANQMLSEYSIHVNELIKALEIPQKLEATREFINFVLSSVMGFVEQLRVTKVADIIKSVHPDIQTVNVDEFFGDLTINFLPALPEISVPEITLPEFSFPVLPHVPIEKLVETLQIPDIKLPSIPSQAMLPCFGKLYGEVKLHTPIYSVKTSAEFQNSTDNEMTPQFTAFLTSKAESDFEILSYMLDASARIAIPKMSRIIIGETLKFHHSALGIDHQASLTIYGVSAQAQAKTVVKVLTEPFTAELTNLAFIAVEDGVSASLDTDYNHNLDLYVIKNTAKATQKAIARLEGTTLTLNVDNEANAKFTDDELQHKSNLNLIFNPANTKIVFKGETGASDIKMNQEMTAECVHFSYFKFNARCETEAPEIKNSLVTVSGHASLYDLKVELKATHDTELEGGFSGDVSNALNVVVRPTEVVFDFQNKGDLEITVFSERARVVLQNDYSVVLKPHTQLINTVALARLNKDKVFYNFTIENNDKEAGIIADVEVEANLDFLTATFNIPEFDLPFVDFRTPAISDFNLYEHTGLNHILTSTEQYVYGDAKIVYQKSQLPPLVDVMGLIQIPSLGNLITELSIKSSILILTADAGLYNEDDLVFRLSARIASVFEGLVTKLEGTTSLATRTGLKLANSLSLENDHIEGTHDSTINLNIDELEAAVSVATVAKIALPILNLEGKQSLVMETKDKASAASSLVLKGDFNIPTINAVGKTEAESSLKLEGAFEYISVESTTKANIEGTVFENFAVLGALDNEANLYLNADGLRSASKVTADAKLNNGETKVLGLDIDENLAVEASMSRVYAVLKLNSNNEANVFTFVTNGKHVAQVTIDLAPASLTADIEVDLSQPSSIGELTIFEKAVVELTAPKQKISTNAKIVTPVYTTSIAAEVEAEAPVLKVSFKSSATSPFVLLDYDMDASTTAKFENEALSMTSKAVLTHTDLTLDAHHVLSQAMRRKRQADENIHTLNLDITSPTFTDVNFRYAARKDGVSASISTPSAGFLGLQVHGKLPQMTARMYSRYVAAPEDDVDILMITTAVKEDEKIDLHLAFNMEASNDMLLGLKERIPSLITTLTTFTDKYEITGHVEVLKNSIVQLVDNVYNVAINSDEHLSQLSIFFRNVFVQYQQMVQVFLDAAVKFLRETHFKLPGSDEMTTLPEVLKTLTSSIGAVLEKTIEIVTETLEVYTNHLIELLSISDIKISMPIGDAMTIAQIYDDLKGMFRNILNRFVELVHSMESVDVMLEKLGETLKAVIDQTQEFVDSIKSDFLDGVFVNINAAYANLLSMLKLQTDNFAALSLEQLQSGIEHIVDIIVSMINQFSAAVSELVQQDEVKAYVKVNGGRLEIDVPLVLHQ